MGPRLGLAAVVAFVGCGRVGYEGAGADGMPARVNLAVNPGCENGTDNWLGYLGELSTSASARTGLAACQVCCTEGAGNCTFDDVINTVSAPLAGQTYRGEAWVRAIEGGTSPRVARMQAREWTDPQAPGANTDGPVVTLSTGDWTLVFAEHTVTLPDVLYLDAFVIQIGADGDCFLVDDVVVELLP